MKYKKPENLQENVEKCVNKCHYFGDTECGPNCIEYSTKREFETTAEKDRHFICEIGRIFKGDSKQCYSADAVFEMVKTHMKEQIEFNKYVSKELGKIISKK